MTVRKYPGQYQKKRTSSQPPVLLQLGFRPFYLVALLLAIIATSLWVGMHHFRWELLRPDIAPVSWHMHEMVFGFSVAVITGFILGSIQRWTQRSLLDGWPLLILALLWLMARLLPFVPDIPLWYLALQESLFLLLIVSCLALPLRQPPFSRVPGYRMALSLFTLLIPASIIYYLGLMQVWAPGLHLGPYLGMYIIVALIFLLGRLSIHRLLQDMLNMKLEDQTEPKLDRINFLLYIVFVSLEIYSYTTGSLFSQLIAALIALTLFPLQLARLYLWYHPKIWHHPQLWVWFLGYAWLSCGFLLHFLSSAYYINPWAAVHAFAYGGLGLIAAGLMAQSIANYSQQNHYDVPFMTQLAFGLLLTGALLHVVLLFQPTHSEWVSLASQFIWVAAFSLLLTQYLPLLLKEKAV